MLHVIGVVDFPSKLSQKSNADLFFPSQVMRTHGFNPSEEDLRDMIRNVDKNANGAIDFNEFIEMMIKQGTNADEDTAHAFKVFDRDGDGLITAEELRLTMNNLGEPLTEAEVNIFLRCSLAKSLRPQRN